MDPKTGGIYPNLLRSFSLGNLLFQHCRGGIVFSGNVGTGILMADSPMAVGPRRRLLYWIERYRMGIHSGGITERNRLSHL